MQVLNQIIALITVIAIVIIMKGLLQEQILFLIVLIMEEAEVFVGAIGEDEKGKSHSVEWLFHLEEIVLLQEFSCFGDIPKNS